jgi:hypothetical protein
MTPVRAAWKEVAAGSNALRDSVATSARSMQRQVNMSIRATWDWATQLARNIQQSVVGRGRNL